jgi:hypothetical protein
MCPAARSGVAWLLFFNFRENRFRKFILRVPKLMTVTGFTVFLDCAACLVEYPGGCLTA